MRDLRRKIESQSALEEAFVIPLGPPTQIRSQQQRQRCWKLNCFHAPEVECTGKRMAAAPHTRAMPDHPYDGHTLRDVIDRTVTLTSRAIERAYVDRG